jgi:hypothetical protein
LKGRRLLILFKNSGKNSRGRTAPEKIRITTSFREERPTISSSQKDKRPTKKETRKFIRKEKVRAMMRKGKRRKLKLN